MSRFSSQAGYRDAVFFDGKLCASPCTLDPPQYYLDLYQNKELVPPYTGDWNDKERLEREGHNYHSLTGPADRPMCNR